MATRHIVCTWGGTHGAWVHVCTPLPTHVRLTSEALTRGAHVRRRHRGRRVRDGHGCSQRVACEKLKFYLPIYPLKGYSLTLDTSNAKTPASAPRISVTDSAYKVVYALLGSELRIAGLADIAGYDKTLDRARVRLLTRHAKAVFPDAGDYGADLQPWCGLRPATPKGTPIVGMSPNANLFLNAGHGALGWTLSFGCAKAVSDLISGQPTGIALEGLTLEA